MQEEQKVGRNSPTAKSTPVLMHAMTGKHPSQPTPAFNNGDYLGRATETALDPGASTERFRNEENKFNMSLQSEFEMINASLSRINGLVSRQKETQLKSQ